MTTDAAWLPPWLRRQLREVHHDGRCIRLHLHHLAGRPRGVKGWTFADPAEIPSDDDIDALMGDILRTAQEDASDLFGRQRYSLCAYRDRRPDLVAESKTFVMLGGGEGDDEDVDSEGPTQRGLLTQLMRHNEANARIVTQSALGVQRTLIETNRVQAERLAQVEGKLYEVLHAYEDLATQKHLRDLATKEHDLKIKVFGEAVDKLALLAPTVVNSIAGRRLLPEAQPVVNTMMDELIDSITQDQMDVFMRELKPEQLVVISNLIKRRHEQRARQQADQDEKDRQRAEANGGTGASPGTP